MFKRQVYAVLMLTSCMTVAVPAMAANPSFDCAKATHAAEIKICEDEELAALDRQMHDIYIKSLEVAGKLDETPETAVSDLKVWQRGQMKGRFDCWKEQDIKACIAESYKRDISKLEAQWRLVEKKTTVVYSCPDRSEFVVTPYQTTILPAIVVEYGDQSEVFISADGKGVRFDGDFGKYALIEAKQGSFVWNQELAPLVCTAQ